MNKATCKRLTDTGLTRIVDETGREYFLVYGSAMVKILKSFDLLDKYPSSLIFDNRYMISGIAKIFTFDVDPETTTLYFSKTIGCLNDTIDWLSSDANIAWNEHITPIFLIKMKLWRDQSDDILKELGNKIGQIIREESGD